MDQRVSGKDEETLRYFRMGDLIVDVAAREVRKLDGTPVDVSGKSYQLLEVLVRAAPEAVTLADIHAAVWGNTQVSDDTVRQRVKLLRQALGTPEGGGNYIRVEHGAGYAVDAVPVRARVKRRSVPKFLLPFMIFLVVATPVAAYLWAQMQPPTPARIYVQPFEALAAEDTYVAVGFTSELIDKLVPIAGLSVSGSGSANNDRLKAVVEGSVRRELDKLHVSVRLIDARSGDYLWARQYEDRSQGDIFEIQANIAAHVALILQMTLDDTAYEAIQKGPTSSVEAYYAYMLGRGHMTAGDKEEARAAFGKALEADPAFELAQKALVATNEN